MKKILLTLVAITFMSFNTLMADEGMWLPYSLNGQNLAQMQALGCKLTADQIFDLNKPSLKDAIVQFGGGCTGELISPNGLLLTNHHCGIGQVQAHSSLEHDYLTDGFWAYELKEELANPGLRVSFLSYVEDVTEVILKNITDEMDEETREKQIADVIKNTVSNKKGDRNVRVQIIPFYHGNQYILFEYDVYEDVRLVACPPWGIGKYGADTDNWTWPRHKGDFCIFRVYTAPDGSPATYSEENIPLKSKHHLPISLKGIEEGDYAMILGYPGSTDRYSSSQNVKLITDYQGPSLVKCRTTKLDVYRKHMDADPEVFIQYASKQAGVSNYWKYYIGQVKQLKRNKVVEKKETTEAEFTKWINQNAQRKEKYGNVLNDFQLRYEVMSKYQSALTYHIEAGLRGGEAIANSMNYIRVNNLIKEKNDYASLIERLRASSVDFFKNYNVDLDRDASIALLNLFYQDIPKELLPELIAKIGDKNNGDFTKYINKAFEKSVFTSQERLNAWFNNPKNLDKDPLFAILTSIRDSYFDILTLTNESSIVESKAARLYMQALMEMYPEKNFYPDANFTMRLTYGSVASYEPADVITYDFVSTMEGVMEKYIPGNWEFGLPNDLIELYNKKDYGEYADKDGQMIVNFITTNDITGGNSGSPVLDGEG
ncbi:S46 family peptidase, partial [Bacteroidales bacterium OttesenSCG-928-K03]|nr:S46 family peptidase [Bacteroidales bacterium OttesenSCG-928-K03]